MKVIRDEDKKSNTYIKHFEVKKGTIQKNTRKNEKFSQKLKA